MSDVLKWKVPKIPFIVVGLLLVGFGFYFVQCAPLHLGHVAFAAVCICSVSLGAIIAILPFYFDYKAMGRVLEVNALGTVAEKIENLDQLTAKICAASDQWTVVHESVGASAEKTAVSAKQIAERMSNEVREFSEFMKKMNDSEKAALRVEVDKFRRGEAEWVQTIVRLLDHVFALHTAAARSGQANVADQIGQFQNACRGTVRRIGLAGFVAEPNEIFNAERHQLGDPKQKPFDGAVIAETMASGYTYQGNLLRPALVRLRDPKAAPPTPPAPTTLEPAPKITVPDAMQDDFALETEPAPVAKSTPAPVVKPASVVTTPVAKPAPVEKPTPSAPAPVPATSSAPASKPAPAPAPAAATPVAAPVPSATPAPKPEAPIKVAPVSTAAPTPTVTPAPPQAAKPVPVEKPASPAKATPATSAPLRPSPARPENAASSS